MKRYLYLAFSLFLLNSCKKDNKENLPTNSPEIILETAVPKTLNFGDSLALNVLFKDTKEMHYARVYIIAMPQNDTLYVARKHAHSAEIHLHEKVFIGSHTFSDNQAINVVLWAENGEKLTQTVTHNLTVLKDALKPNLAIIAPTTRELEATASLHLIFEDAIEMHNGDFKLVRKSDESVLWTHKAHVHGKTMVLNQQLALDYLKLKAGEELELRIDVDNSRGNSLKKTIGFHVKK